MQEMSINTLYNPESLVKFIRQKTAGLCAAAAAAAAGIALSLIFCFDFNAFGAVAASAVAGWICIVLLELLILPARNREHHYNTVLDGEKTEYTGTVSPGKTKYMLLRGVNFYPVTLREGEKTVSLFLYAPFRKVFGFPEGLLRVTSSHGFILSWEVLK